MAKQIGSQYRETLEESGYKLGKKLSHGEIILVNEFGCPEIWFKNDHAACHVIEVNGVGYEFARSGDR